MPDAHIIIAQELRRTVLRADLGGEMEWHGKEMAGPDLEDLSTQMS